MVARLRLSVPILALVVALVPTGAALAQGWGTVTGQVVWGPEKLPEKKKANVDKDKPHCLSKGDIYVKDYVVNPGNKGVRWVLVWLADPDAWVKAIPIHPDLKGANKKPLVIDQPCCEFEPRVAGIMEGQPVVVKNPSPISHSMFWQGGVLGPTDNVTIPAGGSKAWAGIKARKMPILYTCSLHNWMKGRVAVFKHPYFAVTDEDGKFTIAKAPAGKYRLVLWQEEKGWVIQDPKGNVGTIIEIKADGTTDVGKVKLEPPPETK